MFGVHLFTVGFSLNCNFAEFFTRVPPLFMKGTFRKLSLIVGLSIRMIYPIWIYRVNGTINVTDECSNFH